MGLDLLYILKEMISIKINFPMHKKIVSICSQDRVNILFTV